VPGMKTVVEISKMSDPTGASYRSVHYLAGACSGLYLAEAITWAAKNGGVTGANVKNGFYQKKDWVPAGMDGVCSPSTWTPTDHRSTERVDLYRVAVSGSSEAARDKPIKNAAGALEKVTSIDLPRRSDWLGW
jgi:branched-chain amino acid transport system substrate-binding protein